MCNDANAIINRPLPDTLSECRDYIAELQALATQQQALLAEHELLIAALKKRVFGRRSEKSHKPPDEATPAEIAEELKPPKPKKAHSGGGRAPLPKYLPRETTLCDLPEADKVCPECGKPMKCIGVDATEKLDARPIELFVRRVERPRYACGSCKCGVLQQPLAPQALPRTDATAGLATLLVLWKYEDHLPLSRLERILDRSGIELRSRPHVRMADGRGGAGHAAREPDGAENPHFGLRLRGRNALADAGARQDEALLAVGIARTRQPRTLHSLPLRRDARRGRTARSVQHVQRPPSHRRL
jgi:transposase